MLERLSDGVMSGHCGENLSLTPNLSLKKKILPEVEPLGVQVCVGKSLCLIHPIMCTSGVILEISHMTMYQNYEDKPYNYDVCVSAFCYFQCFDKHKRNHNREKVYKCKKRGKTFSSSTSLQIRE